MEILTFLALVLLNIYSSVDGTEIFFERENQFDGFICTTQQYLGNKRSILQCSEACAKETSCVGFFYNHLDKQCNGTSVVLTDPLLCQWSGNTVYYSDASVEPTTTTTTTTTTTSTTTTTTTTTSTTTTTTTTTTTPPPPTCPNGWTQYLDHCYLQDWSDRAWAAAQSNCNGQGGYMLSVETTTEYDFIKSNFDASISWIGATDTATEGVWVWTSGADVTLNHWESGKPDNADYNCHCMTVNMVWGTWEWRDVNCDHMYRSVCEIDLSIT